MDQNLTEYTHASHEKGVPIWLDCDTGHDDAFAILLAGQSPGVRFLGISTVFGNAALPHTTYNSRAILKAINRDDVPVYAGAARPLLREPCHAPDIHGESGLDGTTCLPHPSVEAKTDKNAVDAIHDALIAEQPGTAWLVATGALTNVAALFAKYPGLVDHICGLSIMGGAVGGGFTNAPLGTVLDKDRFGNHTPFAEFNIYCDPDAAQAIFSFSALAAKIILVPLDITHKFLATPEIRQALLFGCNTSYHRETEIQSVSNVRQLFSEILQFFAKTYADIFGFTAGPPTHDPLAVFAAFLPEAFQFHTNGQKQSSATNASERFRVLVDTSGRHGTAPDILNGSSQCGRTIVTALAPGEGGVRIPRSLEVEELWMLIEACLRRAENVP